MHKSHKRKRENPHDVKSSSTVLQPTKYNTRQSAMKQNVIRSDSEKGIQSDSHGNSEKKNQENISTIENVPYSTNRASVFSNIFTQYRRTIDDNILNVSLPANVSEPTQSISMLHYAATNCFAQSQAFWNVTMSLHKPGRNLRPDISVDVQNLHSLPVVQYSKWHDFHSNWSAIKIYDHAILATSQSAETNILMMKFDLLSKDNQIGHSWVIFQIRGWPDYVCAQSFQGRFDFRYTHRLTHKQMDTFMKLMGMHLDPVKSDTMSSSEREQLSELVLPIWDKSWAPHKMFDPNLEQSIVVRVAYPQTVM